ncbi:hypothetical protein [Pedococcus sp. 2YAF34]|uniref:hypothetical protein n=1 Tax=Pedococcus sp. 2YAF34 TaxID=3233032 RepID=UPI003F9C6313
MFAVVLFCIFGLGVVAFAGVIVVGVVNRFRGRRDDDWHDEGEEGAPPKVRPGPGWGNGGSWN